MSSRDELAARWYALQRWRRGGRLERWLHRPLASLGHWRRGHELQRIRRRDKAVERRARLFWGAAMWVTPPEAVSAGLYHGGYFEPDLTTALIEHLPAGGTFLDLGAHYGYGSLLAAHLVGPGGQVHAFEPNRRSFELLRRNLAGLAQVTLHSQAVAEAPGRLELQDYGSAWSSFSTCASPRHRQLQGRPHESYEVDAVTVDQAVAELGLRPDFVKIDVESKELEVLQGMERTLATCRPRLALEVGDEAPRADGTTSRDLLDFLAARGYQPYQLAADATTRQPGHSFEPHVPQKHYVYQNLLFLPAGLAGERP